MSTRQISKPKAFQEATARAALATFHANAGPKRFLIADEVGLGKTVVARTVVAEMMRGKRTPLVVFYFACNLNIAHQNRTKLLEILETDADQKAAAAGADRLTIAANSAKRPCHDRLHLYTLTPDTSVPLYRRRGGSGRIEERALIFRLLARRFPTLDTKDFSDFCRGKQAGQGGWKLAVEDQESISGVREIQDAFLDALAADQFLELAQVDAETIAGVVRQLKRSRLIGSLRTALALAVLRNVKPDLIIFDEFQKFRDLLIDPPPKPGKKTEPLDPLKLALRGGLKRSDAAMLLLSATPYRPYSTRQEEREGFSPYKEFFELIKFLFGPESGEPDDIEKALRKFGTEILSKEPDFARLAQLKAEIEKRLGPVMSRTERADLMDADSHIPKNRQHSVILPEDLRLFKHFVARLRGASKRGRRKFDLMSFAVPFWLSIPYPIQMLGRNYVAWRLAAKNKRHRNEPTLRQSHRDKMEMPDTMPHPQLRVLSQINNPSRLALPWVAPSLPWWDLRGPWAKSEANGGKMLVFSRFKAVPTAIASLLSFNLEASFAQRLRHNYRLAGKAQPLQFKDDRPSLPALFFPSPTLIAFTNPRLKPAASLKDVRNSMRNQVGRLIRQKLGFEVRKRGGCRPLWKLIAILEYRRSQILKDCDLPSWEDLREHWLEVADEQSYIMRAVFNQWTTVAQQNLNSLTESEVAALAEFALSGPGVVLGRALFRFDSACLQNYRYPNLLAASWTGLRSYLNRSLFLAALTRRGQKYTKAIPEAVVAGNLESVLDEHLWVTSQLDADAIDRFCLNIQKVLSLRDGRHQVHEPGGDGFHLRCHAAMPFADAQIASAKKNSQASRAKHNGEDRLRTDDLRRAFNSPFWPHVLATTSLGQEGLDFHVWCRQLLHWDLCSSPLDLEQREGRIQRFGGLSVRTALADMLRNVAFSPDDDNDSPWQKIASHATEKFKDDKSERSPWWSCPGEKIDRLFVVLPQSRQTTRFDQLSRQRWLYRLALGQPHQQDFIETVSQLPQDGRHQYALCLSAWKNGTA
jgi:hypothetical protein